MHTMITLLMVMLTVETTAQMVNTSKVYQSERFGFSQAIIANGFVFTSGIVGWDNNYQLTGDGSFAEQAKQCFKNMELLLKASNSGIENSIHLRIYVTQLSDEHKTIINELLKTYFPNQYHPATTLLCVKALARKQLKIELEAISFTNK